MMSEHNFHRNPFRSDEPPRRLRVVQRDGVWRQMPVVRETDEPTETVEATLEYGKLSYRVRLLPGGELEVWCHGAGYPSLLTQSAGSSNTLKLVPREIFDGPLWKHPAPPPPDELERRAQELEAERRRPT